MVSKSWTPQRLFRRRYGSVEPTMQEAARTSNRVSESPRRMRLLGCALPAFLATPETSVQPNLSVAMPTRIGIFNKTSG